MINRVMLIGNLGRDPEIKDFENNSNVAKLNLATSESYKDKNGEWQTATEWHDVVVWNKRESVLKLKKGMKVYVEGKIITRTYEDRDGNSRRITEVKASYFRSLEKKEVQTEPF